MSLEAGGRSLTVQIFSSITDRALLCKTNPFRPARFQDRSSGQNFDPGSLGILPTEGDPGLLFLYEEVTERVPSEGPPEIGGIGTARRCRAMFHRESGLTYPRSLSEE